MTRLNLAAFTALGACANLHGRTEEATGPVRAPGLWAVSVSYDDSQRMLPVGGVCLDRAADTRLTTGSSAAAENGRRTFTVEAKRVGACAAGQRGGDTITDQKVVDLFTAAPKTN